SVTIHQDVRLYASLLEAGNEVTLDTDNDRNIYVQVVSGEVTVNESLLSDGDGAAISGESAIAIKASKDAEFLVFDMA
ncbi:MAG: pirin family protein, partial [Woeseiaceae bacterium]|nr:pirin family protein [Woeseiaceae bacterium]